MRKKKAQINLTLPATISDFKQDEQNEQFSRAKLKVCHDQETVDKRYFTDKCRDNLFKTLPYTPIVSSYDENEDDFKGHAVEQQIFGIVDPCRDYTFETDDEGKEWCVCDVVLYTERPDSVGKIAQKIVGHSHSLELDPKSVKYEILYDEKKHFKRIEFTEAKFVGLSVLGEKQKPAFSGSVFFNYDERFEEKMNLLKDYCESNREGEVKQEMNYRDFMQLSFGEIFEKADKILAEKYGVDGFTMIRDIYQSSIVFNVYYNTGDKKLLQIDYTLSEDGVLSVNEESVCEVRPTYEKIFEVATEEIFEEGENTADETPSTSIEDGDNNNDNNDNNDDTTSTPTIASIDVDDADDEEKKEEEEKEEDKEEDKEETDLSTSEESQDDDFTANEETEEKVSETQDEQKSVQDESDTATLSESERAEFETLKREKKVSLLDSYKEVLNTEEYNNYLSTIDNFDLNGLEYELLKKYKENASVNKTQETHQEEKRDRIFAYNPILNNNNNSDRDPIADFIQKSKNKRRF